MVNVYLIKLAAYLMLFILIIYCDQYKINSWVPSLHFDYIVLFRIHNKQQLHS